MKFFKIICILMLLVSDAIAVAGEAVSEINGKLDASYGGMESDRGKNITGSISIPIDTNLGFQADGLYTRISHENFYGLGTHLFWRDSQKGLLGISIADVSSDDVYCFQSGPEGEYYLDQFTLGMKMGIAKIKYDNAVPWIDTNETKPYVGGSVGFYPIDDLIFSISYTHIFDNELVQGQIEYQTPISGLNLFADFARGENDYDHNLFGIRYYFGKQKALKQRHREDDPPNIASSVLYSIGTYGAEYNQKGREFIKRFMPGYSYSDFGNYGLVVVMTNNASPSIFGNGSTAFINTIDLQNPMPLE